MIKRQVYKVKRSIGNIRLRIEYGSTFLDAAPNCVIQQRIKNRVLKNINVNVNVRFHAVKPGTIDKRRGNSVEFQHINSEDELSRCIMVYIKDTTYAYQMHSFTYWLFK